MENKPHEAAATAREDRLAVKLRENLRRRKAQARALDPHGDHGDDDALPKAPPPS